MKMIEYPKYEEVGTIGNLSFTVSDISVLFLIKAERNKELFNNYNLIKDTTDLTDEQIESFTDEQIIDLLKHINDVSDSNEEIQNDESVSIEDTVALLISKGHLYAHTYRIKFLRTAIKILADGISKNEDEEVDNFSILTKGLK